MNKKITILIILICTLVVGIGVSLAYFAVNNQNDGNETNLNVTTERLGSILWEGTKVFTSYELLPGQIGVQEFTIEKNSDNGIGIYEIDLAGVLPSEFGTDIEISLYKTTDPISNTVTVNVADPTLENEQLYQEDSLNITGSPELVYQGTLQNNSQIILEQADFEVTTLEKTTYYLVYHYKNNGTQDNQQGKSFSGTISVRIINEKSTYCELHPETGACKILALGENDELKFDETSDNNLRYIGANPNNYVSFNDESWRIIGVMNNIDDGTGNKESRLKIVRSESIGEFSWDSSDASVNSGHGVNEWSQADIMKLLNPGYESENIGGSLYWNSSSGNCYTDSLNNTNACSFENIGLKENAKTYIRQAIWNTGTNGANGYETSSNGLASHWYTYERSNDIGKMCTEVSYCNDTVTRTTTWTGLVGLIYPSDYGYATSGGDDMSREACLNISLVKWNGYPNCYENSWLRQSNDQWTITPMVYRTSAITSMYVNPSGFAGPSNTQFSLSVNPVVYLSSNIKIIGGTGSSGDPFTLTVS